MKRTAIAMVFLSICLGSERAEAQPSTPTSICYDICPALIMPDVPMASLPLPGWVYSGSLVQEVLVIEQPQFGIWDKPGQTYTPSPLFWDIGIDRMRIRLNNDPNDERTIIFQSAHPLIEEENDVYDPPELLTFENRVEGLGLSAHSRVIGNIQTNGVATVGGYVNASVPPPNSGLPGEIIPVLRLDHFAHVQLVNTPQGWGYAAAVDLQALNCGNTCVTNTLPVFEGQFYDITLTLGFDSVMVPSADNLSLRLKVCPASGGACQETAIVGLNGEVDLEQIVGLEVGILGEVPSQARITVGSVTLWRASLGETPAAVYEGFTSGQQSFWGFQGPISATQPARSTDWVAEANLQTMNSTSRAWFSDYRPSGQKRARMLMDLDVSSLNLAEDEYLLTFHAQGLTVNGVGKTFDLFLRYQSGSFKLRGRIIDDSGTTVMTVPITLSMVGSNRLGMHYNASGGPLQNGGTFHLSVNGVLYSLQNLDNDERVFETLHFGASSFSGAPNLDPSARPRLLRLDNLTLVY